MIYVISTKLFDEESYDEFVKAEKVIFGSCSLRRKKNLSVCGRVLLGYILKKNFGIEHISYRYGECGKPYLENEKLKFNISHSGDYVVCCVSENEIGCDIEKINKYNPKISARFFTEKEKAVLLDIENKERAFTRLWTLKESILKKDGTGITGGLDSYCFADKIFRESFEDYGCKFLCRSFCDYELSVCSTETYKTEDIVFVTDDEFMGYVAELNSKNT